MEAVRSCCDSRRRMAIEKVKKWYDIRHDFCDGDLKYGYLSVSMATSLDWIFTTQLRKSTGYVELRRRKLRARISYVRGREHVRNVPWVLLYTQYVRHYGHPFDRCLSWYHLLKERSPSVRHKSSKAVARQDKWRRKQLREESGRDHLSYSCSLLAEDCKISANCIDLIFRDVLILLKRYSIIAYTASAWSIGHAISPLRR